MRLRYAKSSRKKIADFSGSWSTKWCDKTNAKRDCGGFNVRLVQEGDRICGDFGGALVNLRQTDEGSIIGTAVGDTAVLAVESYRNNMISLIRAELHGDILRWREVDNIKRGGENIAIIATNDVLKKEAETPFKSNENHGEKLTCDSVLKKLEIDIEYREIE